MGKRWPPASHKLAVSIEEAAELLHISEAQAWHLTVGVVPYRHQDGSPRWSLRELARSLAGCGRVVYREGP
jgi:hypothetical protein